MLRANRILHADADLRDSMVSAAPPGDTVCDGVCSAKSGKRRLVNIVIKENILYQVSSANLSLLFIVSIMISTMNP